jgi:hypothetical protein
MDVTYTEALIGLMIGSATLWGPLFAFAYFRRQFGGSAKGYLVGFAGTWLATVLTFVVLTVLENR